MLKKLSSRKGGIKQIFTTNILHTIALDHFKKYISVSIEKIGLFSWQLNNTNICNNKHGYIISLNLANQRRAPEFCKHHLYNCTPV